MALLPSNRMNCKSFLATIEVFAQIGVGRKGGLSGLTLTDFDKAMRDVFVTW